MYRALKSMVNLMSFQKFFIYRNEYTYTTHNIKMLYLIFISNSLFKTSTPWQTPLIAINHFWMEKI